MTDLFGDLRRYTGFDEEAAARIRAVAEIVRKHIPRIVEGFHAEIDRHAEARGVFEDDAQFDRTLRPRTFDDYVGQTKHKENLKVFVEASRRRGEPLDHVLLCGPPGLGKTTLAHILAAEMGVELHTTSGQEGDPSGDQGALF